jgi:hypothetical protein
MIKLIDLLFFYIANTSLAYIATQSVLLEEPRTLLSDWLKQKENSIICEKLNYLITCIICSSLWTSFIVMYFFNHSKSFSFNFDLHTILLMAACAPFATMLLWTSIPLQEEE